MATHLHSSSFCLYFPWWRIVGGNNFANSSVLTGYTRQRTQVLIHVTFRFYIFVLQGLGLIKLKIEGADKLANSGGSMVVAKHTSLLDIVVLMALIPRAQCIVKHQLWAHSLLGGLMRRAGYIRNDLEPDMLVAECRVALDEGGCLIIFPEGTRTEIDQIPRFQRGFANVALLTGASILPVIITCDPPTLIKGEKWWHIPSKRPLYQLTVGEIIDINPYLSYGKRSLTATERLVRDIEQHYKAKLER